MRLAVASGKGGTGKSMVAVNLAFTLSQAGQVTLVDCDVEEPNLHLFLPGEAEIRDVTRPVPAIDTDACDLCGRCGEFCQFGALSVLADSVLFFSELCHSCGGCTLVCPQAAIREVPERIGTIATSTPLPGLKLITGTLDTGSPLAVPIIRAAREQARRDPLVICDSSPGTACPVVETLEGSDACILVTESTPFGLHDLELAADVAARLRIPAGVVINRSDGNDRETHEFCDAHGLEVLLTVPFDRDFAAIQNRGGILSRERPEWQEAFATLFEECRRLAGVAR
ncbi:MAG: P-loop NTPase [Methanospirillum sp.]|nr:P-loop NTPase [Methanospirillum sp.]